MRTLFIITTVIFLTACSAEREAQQELVRNYDQHKPTIGVGTDPAEDPNEVPQLLRTPTP